MEKERGTLGDTLLERDERVCARQGGGEQRSAWGAAGVGQCGGERAAEVEMGWIQGLVEGCGEGRGCGSMAEGGA